jgi:hypothetical protein
MPNDTNDKQTTDDNTEAEPVWIDPNGDADTQKLNEQIGHDPAVFGKVGRGKTERFRTALAKAVYDESVRQGDPGGFVAVDDIESTEFIDSKGGDD